jgi:excisionase family DNA binding protein
MMVRQRKDSDSQANPLGEIMTVEGVARYLVCHPSTIYRLVHGGEFPAFRFGSDWRFRREDIDMWIAEHEVKSGKRKAANKR